MRCDLNRRQLLMAAGAGWLGAGAMNRLLAQPKGAGKKVLFFTKSSGFQHSVITRKGDKLAMAEQILTDIGKEHGFEVVASKDGRLFEPDQIGQWDAFVFETTGDLTTPGSRQDTADLCRWRKGVLRRDPRRQGLHRDALRHRHVRPPRQTEQGRRDPYIQMIGGEFIIHGDQQPSRIDIVDPAFPGIAKGFGKSGNSFTITDEWYALKNLADDLHVILVQVTEGMKGHMYERPNFPITWARALWQRARLLHLDGPPRRRLGKPEVPGAACWGRWAGRPGASMPTSSPMFARSHRSTTSCRNNGSTKDSELATESSIAGSPVLVTVVRHRTPPRRRSSSSQPASRAVVWASRGTGRGRRRSSRPGIPA